MTTTPPPVASTPPRTTIFHLAAAYAIWTFPIAIAWSVAFTFFAPALISWLGEDKASTFLQLYFAPAYFILSALPAGVIALCGIRRYGRKKLLWKGLVGVTIPTILIELAIPGALEKAQEMKAILGLP